MLITEEVLDKAIASAKEGYVNGLTYNQESWCGTACCVMGFARHHAGIPEVDHGPRDEEFGEDTPRIRAIRQLMNSPTPAILGIMEKVTPDGKINLTRANLTRADLTDANLTGANLTRANLTRADLTGANLTGANLTRANLTRADLTDADLTGANLTRANLTDARYWDWSKGEWAMVTDKWVCAKGGIR